jgi:hypothetical protein
MRNDASCGRAASGAAWPLREAAQESDIDTACASASWRHFQTGVAAMRFRVTGLPAAEFAAWFTLNDVELALRRARRCVADAPHAFPCRISLTDAEVGDEVLLINHEHLPVDSPYRSRHAIYIRAGETTYDAVDEVPDLLRRRLLSLRAFDDAGMMTACDVVEGRDLETAIGRLFADPQAAYLHAHFARPGCYAARIDRC